MGTVGGARGRFAYLVHTFPLYSLTFVVDEIDTMRDLGADISIFSIRRPPRIEYPAEFERFVDETYYVLPVSVISHIGKHIHVFGGAPKAYIGALIFVLQVKTISIRQRLKVLSYFCEAIELGCRLRKSDFSHIHVHFLFGGALIAFFLRKIFNISYSATGHGSDFLVEKFLLEEKVCFSEFVRVGTEYNARSLLKDLGESVRAKVKVIPFGFDIRNKEAWRKKIDSQIRMRSERSHAVRIVNVGRLVWQKGQSDLIEAAGILHRKGYSFSVEIVGEGELRNELEETIRASDLAHCVSLKGVLTREEIMTLLFEADVFAFPSHSEGFGMALLEAMASGLPAVAADITGISEIIEDDVSGKLFRCGDANDLAMSLEEFINNVGARASMGKAALERVLEKFVHSDVTSRFHDELKQFSS